MAWLGTGREPRCGELRLLAIVALGRAGQGDGGQSDVDDVEFLAKRFDDTAISLEVVADENFPEVGSEKVELSLSEVGHGRQPGDLEAVPR